MIDFMILGLPRSGTTWASNWLTTDTTLCLHDPLWNYHYSELDLIKSNKMMGLSCTGLYNFSDWVNAHSARKVILHRSISEVNSSLSKIGYPTLPDDSEEKLHGIKGIHIYWKEIFTNPKAIYEFLLQKEFDEERHAQLKQIEMQPEFEGLTVDKAITKRLIEELKGI